MATRLKKWFEITGPVNPSDPSDMRRNAIYHTTVGGDTDTIGEGRNNSSHVVLLLTGLKLYAPVPPFHTDETPITTKRDNAILASQISNGSIVAPKAKLGTKPKVTAKKAAKKVVKAPKKVAKKAAKKVVKKAAKKVVNAPKKAMKRATKTVVKKAAKKVAKKASRQTTKRKPG